MAKEIYDQLGISRKEAVRLVELLFDTLKATLADGKTVKIYYRNLTNYE